jgi:hypothetical protein
MSAKIEVLVAQRKKNERKRIKLMTNQRRHPKHYQMCGTTSGTPLDKNRSFRYSRLDTRLPQ